MRNGTRAVPATLGVNSDLVKAASEAGGATGRAHDAYLRFSQTAMAGMGQTLALQARLHEVLGTSLESKSNGAAPVEVTVDVAYDRSQCMEFAIGSVAEVLGPAFAEVDSYPVRVRLPGEPLMLVDRIVSVEGEKGSLTAGRVITEHDVLVDGWYLDGGRMPVCVAVEAGQADLFLCSYLGIDLAVKGTRAYRLLDATITFHRGLPKPGDVIRYDIRIDRFVRQGETYLFFFGFEGTIDGEPVLSMTDGCAGFFTEEEIAASGGIVQVESEANRTASRLAMAPHSIAFVPMVVESYDAAQLDALRRGDLVGCFGKRFAAIGLRDPVRIPGGRMRLVDRVVELDPTGGRYGLGRIRAEADIHADDWFLTCHFVDDRVMPGTLMYECCMHTLRVFLMRMGWVVEREGVCHEPVPGIASKLRCRGPVTAATHVVTYEVEIKKLGYDPEPFVIADALMSADGRKIVQFTDMSLKMTGTTREAIEAIWSRAAECDDASSEARAQTSGLSSHAVNPALALRPRNGRDRIAPVGDVPISAGVKPALFDNDRILAFAVGKPSEAFGDRYRPFDAERRIARLPGPPYKFLDRITEVHAQAWELEPGGWIEGQYDLPADAWFFRGNRQRSMPFAILLEIALQPCGWLAAFLGSALRSDDDLSFRNLGGQAVLHEEVFPDAGTLTTRVRITKVSDAGGMLIEEFDMQIWQAGRIVYDGQTMFGYFAAEALARQVGIRDAADRAYDPTPDEVRRGRAIAIDATAPLTPDDGEHSAGPPAALPAKSFCMIDEVELYVPDGGPHGLGYIRGVKRVDPNEWFFAAHFYQDPVCPGSLGLESFLHLLKIVALERWGATHGATHRFEPIRIGPEHRWLYRGQVIPRNRRVDVDAVITEVHEGATPTVVGRGFLRVDGITIYEMSEFGIRLVPAD